jgi:hypothetical protein
LTAELLAAEGYITASLDFHGREMD